MTELSEDKGAGPEGAAVEHVLRVELDGDSLHSRVECRATEGAACRLVCAEDCGAETYPCYSYDPATKEDREHAQKDGGFCNIAEWINADVPEVSHQRVKEPVFDGMPILPEWEGDYYSWRGIKPSAEPVGESS